MPEQFEYKEESIEQESSVLSYLAEKNRTLINDYKTPDGNYAESCGLIAIDIARLLLKEAKQPSIMSVNGKRVDNPAIIANEPLVPVQYNGRVKWGGHTVCVCDGLVYDPMIGKPVSIEQYAHEAFGAEIEMKITVTEDRISDFVKE